MVQGCLIIYKLALDQYLILKQNSCCNRIHVYRITSKVISYMTVTTTNVLGLLSVFWVFFVTSDIFSINELTLILKMTGQGDVKHVT
jgi:hypothetical protein